jgi:hypothetical protein
VKTNLRRRKRTRCFQLPAAIATAMTVVLVILLALIFFYRSATHSLTPNWASFSDTPKVGTPLGMRRGHPASVLPERAYVETNPDVRDVAVSGQVDPGQLLEVATSGDLPLQPDTQSSFSGSTIALLIWPDEPVSGGNGTPGWIGPGSAGGGIGVPGRTGAGNSGTGGAGSGSSGGAGNGGTGGTGAPGPAGAGNGGTGSTGAPGPAGAGNGGTGSTGAPGPAGAGNGGTGSTGAPGSAGAGNGGTGSMGAPGSAGAGDNGAGGTGGPGPAGAGKGGAHSTVFTGLPGTGDTDSGSIVFPGVTAPGSDAGGNTGTDITHTQFNFGDTTDTVGTDGGDLHEDPVPAVPEPSSILLLLTAVAGAMGARFRLVRSASSARPHQTD